LLPLFHFKHGDPCTVLSKQTFYFQMDRPTFHYIIKRVCQGLEDGIPGIPEAPPGDREERRRRREHLADIKEMKEELKRLRLTNDILETKLKNMTKNRDILHEAYKQYESDYRAWLNQIKVKKKKRKKPKKKSFYQLLREDEERQEREKRRREFCDCNCDCPVICNCIPTEDSECSDSDCYHCAIAFHNKYM